jgi:hypothetical protein
MRAILSVFLLAESAASEAAVARLFANARAPLTARLFRCTPLLCVGH